VCGVCSVVRCVCGVYGVWCGVCVCVCGVVWYVWCCVCARACVCVCVCVCVCCYKVYVFVSMHSLWLPSYRLNDPGFESRKGQGIFSLLQKRPYRLYGPRSLLFDGYQGFFPGGKGARD